MKKLWLIALFGCALAACLNTTDKEKNSTKSAVNAPKADDPTFTTIQWIDSVKDMGTINEGQNVQVIFRFKNVGDKPLVIRSVRASCGCTTPNPPNKPFAPGEEGEITASFDSKGRSGLQHKSIYVSANTKGQENYELTFSVDVIKPKS